MCPSPSSELAEVQNLKESKFISYSPITDVTDWNEADEDPGGSINTTTLIEPGTGDQYIFKSHKDGREHQIWSELLASYIAGDLLGWNVQHTKIARRKNVLGNLLKYFYEHRTDRFRIKQEFFTVGADLCRDVDRDFDKEEGIKYTLPLLCKVHDKVLIQEYKLKREENMDFLARALAFDTLISNQDRHAENWGIIELGKHPNQHTRMAPLYDNGACLGLYIDQVGLKRFFDQSGTIRADKLDNFRKRGCHKLRLESQCKHGSNFEEMNSAFLEIYPDGKRWFEEAAGVDIGAVRDLLNSIRAESSIKAPYNPSCRRIQLVCAILQVGLQRIKNVLY